jgi:hypothetical protein
VLADDDLTAAVDRLCAHVSHWTPPRWAAFGASGEQRGDLMYGLVQQLADLAADAEGQPRRVVPRLPSDLALPDQLRVVARDLVVAAADPQRIAEAAQLVLTVRKGLEGVSARAAR